MKVLNKFKLMLVSIMALSMFFVIGNKAVYATENTIESGIYELQNDVYHESEVGMSMSRSYLLPSMKVEVRKDSIVYIIGFSGSEYMENYRIKLNGEEVPVQIVEENNVEGTVELKVEVDKVDADMDALIYVGPMERDVEFKVIPKIETLKLIESIEEVEEEATSIEVLEEVETEDTGISELNEKGTDNNKMIIIGVSAALVMIILCALLVIKGKKKRA